MNRSVLLLISCILTTPYVIALGIPLMMEHFLEGSEAQI